MREGGALTGQQQQRAAQSERPGRPHGDAGRGGGDKHGPALPAPPPLPMPLAQPRPSPSALSTAPPPQREGGSRRPANGGAPRQTRGQWRAGGGGARGGGGQSRLSMCGFLRTERGRRRLAGRRCGRPIVCAEGLKGRGRRRFFDQSGVDAWRPGRVGRGCGRAAVTAAPRGQRGPDGFRGHPGCLPGTRLPRQRELPVVAAPAGLSRQPRGPPLPPSPAGGCACAVAPRGMLGVVVLRGAQGAPWRRGAGRGGAAITGP